MVAANARAAGILAEQDDGGRKVQSKDTAIKDIAKQLRFGHKNLNLPPLS